MSSEQQIESTQTAAPSDAGSAPQYAPASDERGGSRNPRTKLPFFRMISWMAFYSAAVLFLMSMILFRVAGVQTKIFGGALIASVALLIATYLFPWRR
ncbi:MAG: hypothetical protein ACRD4X_13850 [Candidatus Acidiferrales bacterium]